MKIEMHARPTARIEEFADAHGLIMEVHERSARDYCAGPWSERFRYYAHFKRAEVKEGCMLSSVSGDGRTPEDAIADYARNISGNLLIIDAHTDVRRELRVPRLVPLDLAKALDRVVINATPEQLAEFERLVAAGGPGKIGVLGEATGAKR